MNVVAKETISKARWKQACAGLVLKDRVLFRRHFFRDQLTEEPSIEQKLMFCDNSQRKLYCTGRKIAKCIAGDTLIVNPYTGQRAAAQDLLSPGEIDVSTLNDVWLVEPITAKIWANETVQIFRVRTKSGSSIRVSGNHPFLTGDGWTECESLKPGDLVGMARRMPMPRYNTSGLTDHEIALIAYLIGDGGLQFKRVVFTTASDRIESDFRYHLHCFDSDLLMNKTGKYDFVIASNRKMKQHEVVHPLRKLLIRLGLDGKNSYTKFLPEEIFRLDQSGLSLFLSRLYATDGWAAKDGSVGYASMSRRLIDDIRELLLRFGIFARVYAKRTIYGTTSYALEIHDSSDIIKFCQSVSIFGKEEAQNRVYRIALGTGPSKHDRFPLALVRRIISESGISPYMAGQNANLRFKAAYEPTRDKIQRVAEANELEQLRYLVEGDVYWDEVESVTPEGVEQTYDLHVPETHNFVANGFITHNTIDLEAEEIQAGLLHHSIGDGVDEALMWTPNDVHMVPFVDRIFSRLERNAILAGCVREKRRGENTIVEFRGGLRWYHRIEGTTGTDKNVVGLRACILMGDEQAFGQEAIYKSLIQTALPEAKWVLAGVPNGVRRSPFYRLDQTDLGKNWSRHKYSTYINPIYRDPKTKARLIEDYGGEQTHGYKTQVLGEWGEEMFTSFPPGAIAFGNQKFFDQTVEGLDKDDMSILPMRLGLGSIRCKRFVLGLDYGYSPDPSILWGFYSDDDEARIWRQFLRLKMVRVPQPFQIEVILHVINVVFHGQFMGLASDHLPTIQSLQRRVKPEHVDFVAHASPGSSTSFDMKVIQEQEPDLYRIIPEAERGADTVNLHNKQLWTEWFRGWMINANQDLEATQMILANIPEVIGELGNTTERKGGGSYIVYFGPRDANDAKRQNDHDTDAGRFVAKAIHDARIKRDTQYSEDELLKVMGWAGEVSDAPGAGWAAPWDAPQVDTKPTARDNPYKISTS